MQRLGLHRDIQHILAKTLEMLGQIGLKHLATSGVTSTPSCCKVASTLVMSTTLCSMTALATKSRYLMRFSCSTGSPLRRTGLPKASQSVK